jgi:hypothetical protein
MKVGEKLAWCLGIAILIAALAGGSLTPPIDGSRLLIVTVTYLIGLHWMIAYYFDGTMYGALRLQPTHTAMRVAMLFIGVALVVCALQYVVGLGGPFA